MKAASFEAIAQALNEAGVRYIVVGGLAVIAHGYGRSTYDVDLVVQLTPENIARAFDALENIDHHPQIPSSRRNSPTRPFGPLCGMRRACLFYGIAL